MAIKGRYYEELVKNKGFEKATQMTLRELIEEHRAMEQTLVEYGQMVDRIIDTLTNVVGIAGELKSAHAMIISKLGPEVDKDNPIPEE